MKEDETDSPWSFGVLGASGALGFVSELRAYTTINSIVTASLLDQRHIWLTRVLIERVRRVYPICYAVVGTDGVGWRRSGRKRIEPLADLWCSGVATGTPVPLGWKGAALRFSPARAPPIIHSNWTHTCSGRGNI